MAKKTVIRLGVVASLIAAAIAALWLLRPLVAPPEVESTFTNGVGMEMIGLSTGYYVSKFETTQEQFQRVMGYDPSGYPGANRPVEMVTGEMASEFCARLTEHEEALGNLPAGYVYALPTFAQWQRCVADAPLAGSITGGADKGRDSTSPVGSGEKNSLGLFDMRGNVDELCIDVYDKDNGGQVVAGASYWTHTKYRLRTKHYAGFLHPQERSPDTGFRCFLVKGAWEGQRPSGGADLHVAAASGDLGKVKALIELGVDLDAKDNWGDTPIHRASLYGRATVVRALVEAGANVNVERKFGYAPLHFSLMNRHADVALCLIERGADVDAANIYRERPLHFAARNGLTGVVKALLTKKAKVDAQDENGWTGLLWAARHGHKPIVEELISAGANVNVNAGNNTPLNQAMDRNHFTVAHLLRQHGATQWGDGL